MNATLSYSLLTIVVFVLKTSYPLIDAPFSHIQFFLVLSAYLGFRYSVYLGSIPVIIMGVLDSTFSGASGPIFVFIYGGVFLFCYILRTKANLVLLLYRALAVFLCAFVSGMILALSVYLHSPASAVDWLHVLTTTAVTSALSLVVFPLFGGAEKAVGYAISRARSRKKSSRKELA